MRQHDGKQSRGDAGVERLSRQGDREEHLAQQNDGDKRDDDMEGVRYVNIIIVGIQMGFA